MDLTEEWEMIIKVREIELHLSLTPQKEAGDNDLLLEREIIRINNILLKEE